MSATGPASSSTTTRRVYVGVTPAQRRRALRQSSAILGLWLLGVAIVFIAGWLRASFPVDLTVLLTFIVPVTLVLLIPLARRLAERRQLRVMAEAGLICGHCEYSLQGLDESVARCPECGHLRKLGRDAGMDR